MRSLPVLGQLRRFIQLLTTHLPRALLGPLLTPHEGTGPHLLPQAPDKDICECTTRTKPQGSWDLITVPRAGFHGAGPSFLVSEN